MSVGGGGAGEEPPKKRRLSSRELMQEKRSSIELVIRNGDKDARVLDNPMKSKNGQKTVAGGEVGLKQEIVALKKEMKAMKKEQAEKMKAMEKKIAMIVAGSVPSSNTVAITKSNQKKKWKSAKNRLKSVAAFKQRRRSSLMTSSIEVDLVNNVHVDEATGRQYSINPTTGESEWLDNTEKEEEEAVHVDPATGRRYNSKGWL